MFIGRTGGQENKAVTDAGIPLKEVTVKGIERKLTLRNLKNLFLALRSTSDASKILKSYKPDCVIGTGGYVCWPVLRAAQRLKIPTFIHESNAHPGLVTRLIGRKSTAVLLNFDETASHLLGCETYTVGNPLRKKMRKTSKSMARRSLGIKDNEIVITSFGGSGGSEIMNSCITQIMKEGYNVSQVVRHTHATGRRYFARYNDNCSKGCNIVPYIEDMATIMAASDIVICRCGAMTLSEIAHSGVAAILIPSPNVTDNHQYKNGRLFSDAGAAIMIEEGDLSKERLKEEVVRLLSDGALRLKMSKCLEKFAIRDTEKKICNIIKLKMKRSVATDKN